jgi:predicted CXXCH cytochrome family protein
VRGQSKILLAFAVIAAAVAAVTYWRTGTRAGPARPVTEYADAQVCGSCHRSIAESYRRTGMGRSFYRPRPENTVEDYSKNSTFHAASDQHYAMLRRDGRYYQRRHQIGPGGQEINVVEKEIHFVIGSGNHTRTYLHRTTDGRLLEMPLAWYTDKGGFWAMNPGYDRPDHHGFRRRITYECMFCHNAYPTLPSGADSAGSDPLFPAELPEGIDCQRCHGPGSEHVRAASSGHGVEKIRAAILNPKRLDRTRQLEVCMQCHLETTSFPLPHSLIKYDRRVFSYRPGEPLGDYVLHFDHPPGVGYDDKFEIAHQAYRLRKSACFQKSGTMTCTTCHDPHNALRGAAAEQHYTRVCRSCHEPEFEKRVAERRHPTDPSCLGCHMPRRRTDDVVQVVMTDHFIQRRKPDRDLVASLRERHIDKTTKYTGPVFAYYPSPMPDSPENELLLAIAQVKHNSDLRGGIPKLEAAIARHRPSNAAYYFELGEAYWNDRQVQKAFASYEEALAKQPDFWPALHAYGTGLARSAEAGRAVEFLERAVAAAPQSALSRAHLGLALLQNGRTSDALKTLREALQIDSDLPEAHNALGVALLRTGDRGGAEAAFKAATNAQPDYAEAHKNAAELMLGRGDVAGALYHLSKATSFDPGYVDAYIMHGDALAMQNDLRGAIEQYRNAVRLQPSSAVANFSLGSALAASGDRQDAKRYLSSAVRLKPDYHEAHLQLGAELLKDGRRGDAAAHFRAAAASSDPQIRGAALQALR